MKKYIDDVSGAEKLHCGENYRSVVRDNMDEVRYIHAKQGQALLDLVRSGAASKGMKLNPKKTSLLCINAARSYVPKTFLHLGSETEEEENLIISGKSLKLLGFHFDTSPTPEAHVNAILKKVRYRTWSIHNLKRIGLSPSCLLYTSPSPRD